MKRLLRWTAGVAALLIAGFWLVTWPASPVPLDPAAGNRDLANGEQIFHAGGCASCHGEDLGGGLELPTDFGTFRAPNISSDPVQGIGGWSEEAFVHAMRSGVSPGGRHYYPAFPYTAYARARIPDLLDLKAFIDSLPPVERANDEHELPFPWNLRRGIGLWKRLYLDPRPVLTDGVGDPRLLRGRYLVEALGHCGECHTPRDRLGGLDLGRWLAGGPAPEGEGRVPNITPHEDGIRDWSEKDIAYYLESGFTPDFDTVGGSMVDVQENLAKLGDENRAAIAAYLKAVPALPKR